MVDLSRLSCVGIEIQSAAGTFDAPESADLLPVANLRTNFETYQIENPEYQASIHRNAPTVFGKGYTVSFDVPLRGPGSMPSSDAFILGRLLQAMNMTENLVSTAIPASAEAGSSGTTSALTLGAGATGTAELYDGLVIDLPDQSGTPSEPESFSAIIDYTAGKVATLGETLGATYDTGDYQIPTQAAYQMAETGSAPKLSMSVWLGTKQYDLVDMVPSQASIRMPVSTRGNAQYPVLSVMLQGDLYQWADDSAQTVPALGAIPLFKDGDFWLDKLAIGGSSFEIDLGLTLDYPPNPNYASGGEAGEIVETRRRATINLNQIAKSSKDLIALADAQAVHSAWAMWGSTTGNTVAVIIPDCRLNYPNFSADGNFVQGPLELLVDRGPKSINICFPVW